MSDDEQDAIKKAAGEGGADLVDGGIGLVAGVLVAPVVGPLAPAVGLAVAGTSKALRSLVRSHVQARSEARLAAFEAELARELEATGAVPEELARDERFAEAVFQGYRRVMDAVDRAALEPLARLTARHGRDAGAFFRCCGRFLQDASAEELEALRWVLHHVLDAERQGPRRAHHAGWSTLPDDALLPVGWSDDGRGGVIPYALEAEPATYVDRGQIKATLRAVYRMLDLHGLATVTEQIGKLPTMHIRAGDARRLLDVLGPTTT